MSSLRPFAAVLALALAIAPPAVADLTALARLVPERSRVVDAEGGVRVDLGLSMPVRWRVEALDAPPRIAMEFGDAAVPVLPRVESRHVTAIRTGRARAGWSRLVLDLAAPMRIASAGMTTQDGEAGLHLRLVPDARAAAPERGAVGPLPKASSARPLHVTLDPGHGGIDPGAEADGMVEAPTMLAFARTLRDVLVRAGMEVTMTRTVDGFVPLEARITLARAAGADLFLSLHADALPEEAGAAEGATVYTLADEASDRASRKLAERHDRADLLSGIDLEGQGDEIAMVLMDLARRDTAPRAAALAGALVSALREGAGPLNSHPRREAAFSVLKSPDIPSVLVELGFLSSAADRARLSDPEWRRQTALALRDGIAAWASGDAFRATLLGR